MDRKDHKALISYFLLDGRYLILVLLVLAGCVRDKPVDPRDPLPSSNEGKRVLVACEGSLGNGNSSLSYYRPDADSIYADIYKAVNEETLGDVFQSVCLIGDQYLLCINNSDKIIAISRFDFKIRGTLSVPKPRYILPVGGDKAYVSTLFSKRVYVISTSSLQVTGSFDMPGMNPEGMLLEDGKALICTWDTAVSKVYVIDGANDKLEDSITIGGRAPQEAVKDKEGMIWVLSGNVAKGKAAAITRINPITRQALKTYQFAATADPIRLMFNEGKDTLYFIEVNYDGGTQHNGIYRMSIYDQDLPQHPLIPAQTFQYYWALGIEPGTGNIYVGDPKGFIQKGTVYVYTRDGGLLRQFNVGVGPGHIYFDY